MPALEQTLHDLFVTKGLTLSTAESCTGGLLASRITDVAGSSAYFIGGVVSYAYSAKEILLYVSHEALISQGAVDEMVAKQMARSIRERLGTDVAVSITGIAGPTGGTPEKPVGLVWIGLSDKEGEQAHRFVWNADRLGNKRLSTDAALEILIAWAKGR